MRCGVVVDGQSIGVQVEKYIFITLFLKCPNGKNLKNGMMGKLRLLVMLFQSCQYD